MATAQRQIEVDFLRGLALLFIVVDHVNGSFLARFTLRNFAACDAAEVFVFLAGYSAAAAYIAIEARHGVRAARSRFLRRGWEIYRAFVVAAMLMLLCGFALKRLGIPAPAVHATEICAFLANPVGTVLQILGLVRQPYLSDVLPMYGVFVLFVPLAVRYAKGAPLLALAVSVGIWLMAPWLGKALPGAATNSWAFNPFAWQLMFMLGLVARLRPDSMLPRRKSVQVALTGLATVIALLGILFAYLWMRPSLQSVMLPSWMQSGFPIAKQNLAALRLISFLGLAWLTYLLCRAGWIERLARALSPVVQIGRRSLFCFVTGSAISVIIEGATYGVAAGMPHQRVALVGDLAAVALLLLAGVFWDKVQNGRRRSVGPVLQGRGPQHPAR